MEILTYVFAGKLEHRDTLGSHGIVESGSVQFLSAGTGLQHSEFNASDRELHFAQMWVLPGTVDAAPTYGQIDFDAAARHNRWLAVASGETVETPIRLTQSATLRVAGLADAAIAYDFAPGRLGFLFAGSGSAEVTACDPEGQSYRAKLGPGDAIRMRDLAALEVSGTAELVFWDVPPLEG